MEVSKHNWYVIGSHESEIGLIDGWADLELECIADHNCDEKAAVMVNIQSSKIEVKDN